MLSPIYSLQELLPFPKSSASAANAANTFPALASMNFGVPVADEKPARQKRRKRPKSK